MAETLNQGIKRYRKKLGYTQEYVANQIGEKLSTYSQMERKGNITCKLLIELTEILQVDALTLLYGQEKSNETEQTSTKYPEEMPQAEPDMLGIPPLVANNLYEKFAVLAMRNLLPETRQEVYEYII